MINDWLNPSETKKGEYEECSDCFGMFFPHEIDEHSETGKHLCNSCMKKQRAKDDDLANEKEEIAIELYDKSFSELDQYEQNSIELEHESRKLNQNGNDKN